MAVNNDMLYVDSYLDLVGLIFLIRLHLLKLTGSQMFSKAFIPMMKPWLPGGICTYAYEGYD